MERLIKLLLQLLVPHHKEAQTILSFILFFWRIKIV